MGTTTKTKPAKGKAKKAEARDKRLRRGFLLAVGLGIITPAESAATPTSSAAVHAWVREVLGAATARGEAEDVLWMRQLVHALRIKGTQSHDTDYLRDTILLLLADLTAERCEEIATIARGAEAMIALGALETGGEMASEGPLLTQEEIDYLQAAKERGNLAGGILTLLYDASEERISALCVACTGTFKGSVHHRRARIMLALKDGAARLDRTIGRPSKGKRLEVLIDHAATPALEVICRRLGIKTGDDLAAVALDRFLERLVCVGGEDSADANAAASIVRGHIRREGGAAAAAQDGA